MRIAYLVNQYPKVSHSFIRREILALERAGFTVMRVALRGWDGALVDDEDLRERERTRYVLRDGLGPMIFAVLGLALRQPLRFVAALRLVVRLSFHADRPLPYHLIYLAEACRLLPWLREHGATHIHAHFGTNSTEVVMLARVLGGPPYSFTVHGPEEFDKPQFIRLGEKVARSAFAVAISSYGRSQLMRWVDHAHWAKIKVVHCGLEEGFHAIPAVPIPSEPRLVCVGRLCEQKGQLLLIEAVSRLAGQGIGFELVLAGDGEMRPDVEALVAHHRLQDKVRITGWISSDQVRDEILAARALVLPSFAEGLPVVIMEAMALCRPVLSTYVAGIPELVRPGEHGDLFPAGDVAALALAMERMLARPLAEVQAMGEAARARVLERHDIATEAAKLAAHFRAAGARP